MGMIAKLMAVCAALALMLAMATEAKAQLPAAGKVDSYAGVQLKGQCVPNARALGEQICKQSLPYLGPNGVAADLWNAKTPGFVKIASDGKRFPPVNSFIVYGRGLGGTGHVCMCVGVVDPVKRIVRVVDTNWNGDGKGLIHDIPLGNGNLLGWLVAQ